MSIVLSAAAANVGTTNGLLTVVLTAAAILLFMVIVVLTASVTFWLAKRSELRHNSAMANELAELKAEVAQLRASRTVPGTAELVAKEVLGGRSRAWAWPLSGLVIGAIVGYFVQRFLTPIGPVFRGTPLWNGSDYFVAHLCVGVISGGAIFAMFCFIAAVRQRRHSLYGPPVGGSLRAQPPSRVGRIPT